MDVISDVLTATRVESAVYARLEATAPWGFSMDSARQACFGMVVRGNCWLSVGDSSGPILLSDGDCFLLSPGSTHILRDAPGTLARDKSEVFGDKHGGVTRFGGGGAPTTIIGGQFTFDESDKPMLDLLPPLVHIPAHEARNAVLQNTLKLLESETAMQQPGSQLVINRLADIFFIHAVRAYLASNDSSETGRLRALADHQIGAAIKAMHEKIEHRWTVVALALIAGMSRSAFAVRFKELVGVAPLEYLTRWRMNRAASLLREHGRKLFEVANSVGYDSDGAFHKAFKRVLGVTPGEYRRGATPSFQSGD